MEETKLLDQDLDPPERREKDKMDGWMGWMGGWMDGWMDEWVDGWMDGYICILPIARFHSGKMKIIDLPMP